MAVMGADYEEMKARQKRCVCRQCGRELEIRMIIFCQYGGQGLELYCPVCQRIEYGVEKELFALANKFIKETEFNYFLDMPEDKRSLALNKAKIGELFSWLFYELGLCDKDGLTEKYKILQE